MRLLAVGGVGPAGCLLLGLLFGGRGDQTLGRLQRYRRLRVDDEMSNETSRHMTVLASLFMTGMRLERMLQA